MDLTALADECIALFRSEAAEKWVTIERTADGRLEAAIVRDRIVQMLLNLMKNAVQAMPDGGVMKIELKRDGRSVRMIVSDTGVGIAPEHLGHIFEPFWTTKATGTGLGLALCRKVAEEHGGSLTVESGIGGTVFSVALPTG